MIVFDDKRIAYLQMIESVIDRMSTKSGNMKGFCATVFAGIVALTFKDTALIKLALCSLSILFFLYIDMYYLGMERKYRFLYEKIRNGADVDFNLKIDFKESELKQSNSGLWDCIKSKTTMRFYIPIMIILIIMLILKYKEVI